MRVIVHQSRYSRREEFLWPRLPFQLDYMNRVLSQPSLVKKYCIQTISMATSPHFHKLYTCTTGVKEQNEAETAGTEKVMYLLEMEEKYSRK